MRLNSVNSLNKPPSTSNMNFPPRSSATRWWLAVGLVAFVTANTPAAEAAADSSTLAAPAADIFVRGVIPSIEIEIPEAGLQVLRAYKWREVTEDNPREDVQATVREGDRIYTNVAVHLKGSYGSFRPIDSDKPALTLNFDKFAKGQRFHGLQKLHLNNSVQDPSYISEIVSRELFAKAGIPVPRAGHLVVSVNGRRAQLYVLVEGWNKQFLKRHFKNTKGNLYDGGAAKDIDRPIEVQSGDKPEDRSRLQDLLMACRETNAIARTQRLDEVLDTDQFVSFLAMELLTVHWDGYARNRNNYRIFHNLDTDRFVFLPHGLDQMFGMWRSTPRDSITPMCKGIVAKAVMGSPALRSNYLQRASVLFTNVFDFHSITTRVHELSRRIQPHLLRDIRALTEQDRAATWFMERISERMDSVRDQLHEELVAAVTPLAFDGNGTARLKGWRESTEAGNAAFAHRMGEPETLRISAENGYTLSSWRTKVLLAEGSYRFTGRVKTDRLATNGVPRGGVTLRVSGERAAPTIASAADWTALTYDFEVSGLLDTELVCELRASRGTVVFDADSLRLTRLKAPTSEPLKIPPPPGQK